MNPNCAMSESDAAYQRGFEDGQDSVKNPHRDAVESHINAELNDAIEHLHSAYNFAKNANLQHTPMSIAVAIVEAMNSRIGESHESK